ncbi:polyprenyl synthetase family protein [Pseudoclavibacter sp. CFCC 11306]|uniref:polyprenyl synthetase family protein n=1 Tax=Pseudoclavibacter sp. CFCC 11306 TaxID=1564493 RepID=UPI0013010A28|nr:polyprenyl synthetase family protein [Pseudoclavibacter sp. CFCC 11306]KAB1657535.1 polyprenyl synthetase family protein [Pseudoclavibacter sp. CFCC 11306]
MERGNDTTRLVSGPKRFFLRSEDRQLVGRMEQGLEDVERRIVRESTSADSVTNAATRYLVEAGGKRVRPLLALLASELGDGVNDGVLEAATGVELTHVASLYHDDVMDEADTRRSVTSAHRIWGNNAAILAGDILFARASMIVSELGQQAIMIQAHTFERLCLGQLHETLGPDEGADPIEHYLQVLADKTGSLIAAAGELGVLLGGAPDEYRVAVRRFGECIGVAFQLVDDVIDLRSTSDELGKTPGTDLREGVPTLPWLLLQRQAETDPEAAAVRDEVKRLLADDDTLDQALATLASHPVTDEALTQAKAWAKDATDALKALPAGHVRDLFVRLADYIVSRSH